MESVPDQYRTHLEPLFPGLSVLIEALEEEGGLDQLTEWLAGVT